MTKAKIQSTIFQVYEISSISPTLAISIVDFRTFLVFPTYEISCRIKLKQTSTSKPGSEMFHVFQSNQYREFTMVYTIKKPTAVNGLYVISIQKFFSNEAIGSWQSYAVNIFWVKEADSLKYDCISAFPRCTDRNIFWLPFHT